MITPQQRRTIILVLLFGLVLLIVLLLVRLLYKPKAAPVKSEPVTQTQQAEPTNMLSQEAQKKEQEARSATADVLSLAKQFVARFGSYSNESTFENIRDLLPLMSESYAQKTEADLASKVAPKEYYGVTTRVITAKTTASSADKATVLLNTQRQESVGSPQNSQVKYQEIQVGFVKEAGVWKIDSATWK